MCERNGLTTVLQLQAHRAGGFMFIVDGYSKPTHTASIVERLHEALAHQEWIIQHPNKFGACICIHSATRTLMMLFQHQKRCTTLLWSCCRNSSIKVFISSLKLSSSTKYGSCMIMTFAEKENIKKYTNYEAMHHCRVTEHKQACTCTQVTR